MEQTVRYNCDIKYTYLDKIADLLKLKKNKLNLVFSEKIAKINNFWTFRECRFLIT